MKTMNKIIGLSLLALVSCGENQNGDVHRIEITNKTANTACLLSYQDNYHKLLNPEWIVTSTGLNADNAETDYSKIMSDKSMHEYSYRWAGDRKRNIEVAGMNIEVDRMDIISVKGIKEISLQRFSDMYRVPTTEEKQRLDDEVKKAAEGNSDYQEVNAKTERAKKLGVEEAVLNDVMSGMSEIMKEIADANTPVMNLGESANWNTKTNELAVYTNGLMFIITCDLSDDESKNKSCAIELAKKVLLRC
jgi:hypothetical protein